MNRIFKFKDYKKILENQSIIDSKENDIRDIVKKSIKDFCFENFLEYEIDFGVYLPKMGSFFVNKLLDKIKGYETQKCFQLIIRKPSGQNTNVVDVNEDDYHHCISNLKYMLEKKIHILNIDFRNVDHWHFYSTIQITYE